jgi:hypothetical protein
MTGDPFSVIPQSSVWEPSPSSLTFCSSCSITVSTEMQPHTQRSMRSQKLYRLLNTWNRIDSIFTSSRHNIYFLNPYLFWPLFHIMCAILICAILYL